MCLCVSKAPVSGRDTTPTTPRRQIGVKWEKEKRMRFWLMTELCHSFPCDHSSNRFWASNPCCINGFPMILVSCTASPPGHRQRDKMTFLHETTILTAVVPPSVAFLVFPFSNQTDKYLSQCQSLFKVSLIRNANAFSLPSHSIVL